MANARFCRVRVREIIDQVTKSVDATVVLLGSRMSIQQPKCDWSLSDEATLFLAAKFSVLHRVIFHVLFAHQFPSTAHRRSYQLGRP
jgi:hypothetical protein